MDLTSGKGVFSAKYSHSPDRILIHKDSSVAVAGKKGCPGKQEKQKKKEEQDAAVGFTGGHGNDSQIDEQPKEIADPCKGQKRPGFIYDEFCFGKICRTFAGKADSPDGEKKVSDSGHCAEQAEDSANFAADRVKKCKYCSQDAEKQQENTAAQ